MSKILKNKEPKTTFIDDEDNIEVQLISYPDPKMTEKMFVNMCYGHRDPNIYYKLSKNERKEAIKTLIKGGSLPKGLEMCGKFVFLVKNISLTISHAFVRHRFVTILQSSTAISDLRNENFLMPRAFARNREFYKRVKLWYLQGKELFCEAVDKHNISVQSARYFIPKNNCNWMFMGFDLKSFSEAYSQRMCSQEEPIQHNIVFGKMRDLILKKFPYLEPYFVVSCDVGKCFHSKAGKENNIVFKRNELHKKFLPKDYDLKKEETLHDFTRDQLNFGPVIKKESYIGFNKIKKTNKYVDENKYEKINKKIYRKRD